LSISLAIKCIIVTSSILLAAVTLMLNVGTSMANQQASLSTEDLEELRENLMEVRLALQKGDLIEALQHLNNVDEDLLLLETSLQTSNSSNSSLVYGNSSNSDISSNLQAPGTSMEEGGLGANYGSSDKNDNKNTNSSNDDYVDLGQNKSLPDKDTIFTISNNTLDLDRNASSVNQERSEDSIRKLNVTFNSILINFNHDILFPAEWKLDAYVNNKRVQLSDNSGLDRVDSGQAIDFKGKSIAIDLPENSTLRIATVGAELDEGATDDMRKNNQTGMDRRGDNSGEGVLPDISGILDTQTPLRDKVENSVQFLTTYDRNDAIGIITMEFDARNNFGIGDHYDCSESTGEVGDIFDTVDTNCDYRLSYTIEERQE
jgi:hypothetical protein